MEGGSLSLHPAPKPGRVRLADWLSLRPGSMGTTKLSPSCIIKSWGEPTSSGGKFPDVVWRRRSVRASFPPSHSKQALLCRSFTLHELKILLRSEEEVIHGTEQTERIGSWD